MRYTSIKEKWSLYVVRTRPSLFGVSQGHHGDANRLKHQKYLFIIIICGLRSFLNISSVGTGVLIVVNILINAYLYIRGPMFEYRYFDNSIVS